MTAAVLAGLAVASGCAPLKALKSKIHPTSTTSRVTPRGASAANHTYAFPAIVNELQRGRYAEGERQLRRYLARHPGDRAAQAMLQQLTADPKQLLGPRWRPYVAAPGDTYSSLAARFLGDSQAFLILARYNGSTNPSVLQTGETVRLPVATRLTTNTTPAQTGAPDVPLPLDSATAPPPSNDDTAEEQDQPVPATKAQRLQLESLALLDNGQHDQAMARLGEALAIEPGLKPAGPKAATLREHLLGSYHQRAIVLYRHQELDQAIALWDRILAINPAYEPAVIYRARALDLKQRLKQL